jgi:hypothetical protein
LNENKTSRWTVDIRHEDTYYVASGPLELLKLLFRKLFGRLRKPKPPGDPFSQKLAPVRRGPKGRSGAAVADFDDESPR